MGDPAPPRLRTPPAAAGFTNLNVDVEASIACRRRSDVIVIRILQIYIHLRRKCFKVVQSIGGCVLRRPRLRLCNGKERSDIPPRPIPPITKYNDIVAGVIMAVVINIS
ncbi:unnamed protein product [Arctia plantaginis]|uniref:Uncharacterized protein n=1 Tax=Arctia plantaginis TaxID=874455 RepID=A0A8S0ZLM9_ARCPL|nr:unnamed protein product [Arctia plantaginis]